MCYSIVCFNCFKVLAIYTFSRRCNMEEYESKSRKSVGYSTVTHFNVIHVDCHTAAVRSVKYVRVPQKYDLQEIISAIIL